MQRHYTDGELLAFLDGEVGRIGRWRIQLHLFRCWDCRGSVAEIEGQAHRFAQALRNDSFPGPERLAEARERFERWTQAMEPAPAPAVFSGMGKNSLVWIAACLIVLAAAFTYRKFQPAKVIVATGAVTRLPDITAAPPVLPAPAVKPQRVADSSPSPVKRRRTRPDEPELTEADVHYRLHRIGACAAEPVLITRAADGKLLVTAVAPPPSRRKDIEQALRDLEQKGVVAFRVAGETAEPINPEAVGDATQGGQASGRLANSPLAQSFGGGPELVRRSSRIVKLAEAVYAQAWALHRHETLGLKESSESSPARWLAEAMHRDHTLEVQKLIGELQGELSPIVEAIDAACPSTDSKLFDVSGELTAVIHRLFAPAANEDLGTVDEDVGKLAGLIRQLHCATR